MPAVSLRPSPFGRDDERDGEPLDDRVRASSAAGVTKNAAPVAATSSANTTRATARLARREGTGTPASAERDQRGVRHRDRAERPRGPPGGCAASAHADRAAVADDQRGHAARPRCPSSAAQHALHVLLQRLAAREAEVRRRREPRRPGSGSSRSISSTSRPSQSPRRDSASRSSTRGSSPISAAHDRRRLGRAAMVARPQRLDPGAGHLLRERARLLAPAVVQRRVEPALDPTGGALSSVWPWRARKINRRAARPWKSSSVSARSPSRSVSSEITSAGRTLPRLTSPPKCSMNQTCWCFCGASKIRRSRVDLVRDLVDQAGARLAVGAVEAGVAGGASLAHDAASAPASSASRISSTQRYGASSAAGSFSPTSANTVKSPASGSIRPRLLVVGDRDRAARDLDVLDAQLGQPRAQGVHAALEPRELGERAAEHHRHAGRRGRRRSWP